MREDFTDEHMAWCNFYVGLWGGRSAQILCIIRSKRIPNIHTAKIRSAFGTGWSANLTRDLFMNQAFIEKRVISTELPNVN